MRNIANSKLAFLAIVAVVAVAMVAVYMKGHLDGSVGKGLQLTPEAQAAKAKVSPVKARGDRGVYYPNTENLGRNEIRVIACGTGMPTPRPAQAAACFLMELGNGDKFIFDIGAGSTERLFAKFRRRSWTKSLSGICMETISEILEPCLWQAGLPAVSLR